MVKGKWNLKMELFIQEIGEEVLFSFNYIKFKKIIKKL